MTKRAQQSLIALAALMANVSTSAVELNPEMLSKALFELSAIAKKFDRLAEIMCDTGLTERQERNAERLEARVEAIFKTINANMPTSVFKPEQEDYFIPETQHGDPRYATIKIWHKHFTSDRTPGDDGVMRGCEIVQF